MAQTINSITTFFAGAFSDLSKITPSRGFQAIFANAGPGSRTLYVDNATQISIDLIRGYKKISKLLQRSPQEGVISLGENVKHVKAQTFQNVAYDFPIIRDTGSVSYSEALKYRIAGQVDTDASMSVVEKSRDKMYQIIQTIIKQHAGRMEAQAAEAILTAKCTLDDGGVYDFDRSTSNTIVPSTLWSVTASASPLEDLDDACDAIQENGKTEGEACIMGSSAYNAMVETDQIKNYAKDNNRVNLVSFGKQSDAYPSTMQYLVDAGFKYKGSVLTYKDRTIYIFGYNEKYQNAAGTWVNYMNAKDALVFDHMAVRDRYFGPQIRYDVMTQDQMIVNQMLGIDSVMSSAIDEAAPTGILDFRMFHLDTFIPMDRTSIMAELYTGPLYVPTAVDTTALLDGVIA